MSEHARTVQALQSQLQAARQEAADAVDALYDVKTDLYATEDAMLQAHKEHQRQLQDAEAARDGAQQKALDAEASLLRSSVEHQLTQAALLHLSMTGVRTTIQLALTGHEAWA